MRMGNFKTLWVLEEHKSNNYRNEGKLNIAKKHKNNLGYAPFREWFHNYPKLMKIYKDYKKEIMNTNDKKKESIKQIYINKFNKDINGLEINNLKIENDELHELLKNYNDKYNSYGTSNQKKKKDDILFRFNEIEN